ncbi:transketolase C-terminal domain-containing protein [Candidatus Solincola tengchongensis]|uniref:transketolase C-terminal domain-containing protein n=1 Tax=Candidatus Solincola tengchongensis TaxID=2900693 RepID=UPI00257E8717|nr:transketolase C-terminal domain-containing protein [Candidatus Solincola tengchongensis]
MARERRGIEVSLAVAEAVGQADCDVIAAYPITPQTHIVEHLSEMVAEGHLDAEFIPVESEHSAMSVCCGAAAVGARTFTSTSSQGLALMAEIFFIASAMRLPVVMALANRSLSAPLSIWNDHTDTMMVRDGGWIHVFVENGQEAYDHVFWAFRVAEDPEVRLPVAINIDGFILTHMIEPIEFEDDELIRRYIPEYRMEKALHPDNPVSMGCFGMPEIYTETQMAREKALVDSYATCVKGWEEWAALTGRRYNPIETYRADDAEYCIVTMGSLGETAMAAVDELREQGEKVGVIKIRLWRPFPFADLYRAVDGKEALIVLDRAISFGGPGGPVALEVRSAMYRRPHAPAVVNYVAGLASRDVRVEDFKAIILGGKAKAAAGDTAGFTLYGVRE